jgi:hypothetical protein
MCCTSQLNAALQFLNDQKDFVWGFEFWMLDFIYDVVLALHHAMYRTWNLVLFHI